MYKKISSGQSPLASKVNTIRSITHITGKNDSYILFHVLFVLFVSKSREEQLFHACVINSRTRVFRSVDLEWNTQDVYCLLFSRLFFASFGANILPRNRFVASEDHLFNALTHCDPPVVHERRRSRVDFLSKK